MKYLEMIEAVARERHHAPAVRVSTGAEFDYGEVWAASDALAAYISAHVERGVPVMVYGNKDPFMVVGFLACMKAGCPYVPVDCTSVPAKRVASIARQITREGSCPLVLATEDIPRVEEMPPLTVLSQDEFCRIAATGGESDRGRWIAGEDIAYILFTSGSTGAPKGVEITAACFDNFCAWDVELARMADEGRSLGAVWLDQAPFSFDLSVFEMAGALASGGSLYSLASATQSSASSQMKALADSGVQVWVSTPSFAELCLANVEFRDKLLPDLRLFIFCGETLPNMVAAHLLERFPAARILNTYGPTESTVAVTSVEVTADMASSDEPLPVGVPRPGTRLRIVDADGSDCEPGVFGEVVIEGNTVARGYFGRDDLTARAFGQAELDGEQVRAYRTGDEGMLDEDGMLHFRGRLDLQVKLNGFRIELGEIEEQLRRLPEVAAAAVTATYRDGKVSHLVAHVVPARPLEQTPFREGLALKERLKATLPHYTIPKKVAFRDSLPMTGNGKLDRRSLQSAGC